MNLILIIKSLVPPLIWKFLKKLKREKRYNALNELDKKLEQYLNYEDGYFIELGANNGVEQSNTFYFEKYKNWNGILIEPILHKYIDCKKNRSNKNKFYCCACVSFDFKDEYVKLLYSNLMTIPTNLESDIKNKFDHANLSNTIRKNKEEVIEFYSKAKTLNSILIETSTPDTIDFLSLDVEGSEIEVLKGIDFNFFKFRYILIETRNLETIELFLKQKNYILIDALSHHDFLFKNKF
tara:strand:+ start:1826 stop:2539 length:714 start_codon:yes stop_codon:yes gene_type:complete